MNTIMNIITMISMMTIIIMNTIVRGLHSPKAIN